MSKIKSELLIIYGLGIVNVLIHLAVYDNLEYHRDELLYFSFGLHPAFGYATVPPLIGWTAFILQHLLGFSLFAVKLFPAILSGVFTVLSAAIAREMGGKTYAQILTAIAVIIMPATLRAFHLFQPVPLDLFFWTLITWLVLRYVNSGEDKFLIMLGAVSGLAMLNKYLVALYILALLIAIFFSPYRKAMKKKAFFTGLALGMLVFLPNLIWQIAHGLPVTGHMQALNEYQLVYVNRFDFLKDQLLMPFAATMLTLPGFVYLFMKKQYRFMALAVTIVLIALLALRGKSYYTMGVLPLLIASGAVFYENVIKNRLMRIGLPVALALITLPVLPLGLPVYGQDGLVKYYKDMEDDYGLTIGRRFEDGTIHSLPQDYADQLGWEELTEIAAKAYSRIPDKGRVMIFCENYGQAGAIAVIGKKYGLPEPVSFHGSFIYWVPTSFDEPIEYFIYINNELGDEVKELFAYIEVVGSISNINAREYGTTVYLCSKPRMDLYEFWKKVLAEKESNS